MKIAIVGPYPRKKDRIVGGVEAVVAYLSEELTKCLDLELHFITCAPDIGSEMVYRGDGLTIHYLPQSKRFASLTQGWADERRIASKIKRIDPDVVHAQGVTAFAGGALRSGYPSVVTVHGITARDLRAEPGLRNQFRAALAAHYSKSIIKRTRHLVAISPYVLGEFGALLKAHVYVLENPIHRKFYEIDGKPVPRRLLFAGRIIRRKRVLELIESIRMVRDSISDVELRIAGDTNADPTYFKSLVRYVQENALENSVHFLGSLDEQSILGEYASCSLVVLTSIQETAPMAIQQAMAAGKAVVSTRVCGVPYLVEDGVTGLLVEVSDKAGFAEAVTALLEDDVRREAMGRRARVLARRFRSDEIARKHVEVYRGLLSGRPSKVGAEAAAIG